ncbi:PE-PPE domain-containing protein [Mycobacterium sp. PSTR-4-N]|uniref:PE-PPE domain-containing protein n=1 Tax=Mycobacterium sp. PSTR-4-N TaxID=2917745 RepID=UPI001F154624|nr:PE-PPE domain-containing protein [Mycobacterium sp. PSTR-4-N]MCG7596663.1 PE-PPE domain-containing protein [Mycobacterium sp. PSTR-4-N]
MNRSAKRSARRWVAVAAAAAIAPLAVGVPSLATAPEAIAALPDQLKVVTLALYPGDNSDDHGGIMCTGTRTCSPVTYPYLDRYTGADDLQKALAATDFTNPMVVFGYSQGARVVGQWLEDHAGTEGVPTREQMSFVLIGNPDRKYGGTHRRFGSVTPATDYDIIDVTRQYDRASDWPDNPMNLLAFLNANAGLTNIHVNYDDIDIYDPANYVWKEGNTIYVFVPTEDIPLLDPLRKMGLDKLADELNGPLKAKIEKGYDRSYLPDSPGWPPDLLPPVVPPTPEPNPEPEPQTRTATPLVTALTTARDARKVRAAESAEPTDAEPEVVQPEVAPADEPTERDDLAQETAPAAPATTVAEKSTAKKEAADRTATRKRPFARLFDRHTRASHTAASADSTSATQ